MIHLTSVTRKIIMSLVALLLLSALPVTNALAQMAYCDPKLGRNFDQQSDEVRLARMNLYFDCRLNQDFRFLQTRQKQMLGDIQNWESRSILVARSTLRTKRHIFNAELRTIHFGQRNELATDYGNQFAQLDGALTPENRADINSQRRELTATHRTAMAEQSTRQRREVSLLRDTLNQCSFAVGNELKQLMNQDYKSVGEQFLTKSTGLTNEYQTLKKVPMDQSLNQYLASQPTEEDPVETFTVEDPVATFAVVEDPVEITPVEDPIGVMTDVEGEGTITRPSGEVVDATPGTAIGMGDVVEMMGDSGCNILFIDQTSMTISSDSRVTIDEYNFEPESEDESTGFNFLRAVFLFTSGLIGRQEVSDVDVIIANVGFRG